MPSSCCICGTRRGRDDVSFFRFPKKNYISSELKNLAVKRQELWLKIIGKLHLKRDLKNELLDSQISHIRVCSRHFFSGRSAALQEVNSPDWVPSLNLMKLKRKLKIKSNTKRISTTKLKEFRRLKKKTKLLKPYLEYILNEQVNDTSEEKQIIYPKTLMKVRSELQTRIQNKRKVKIASRNLKKSTSVQRVKTLEEIVVEVFPCTDDEHNYAQIPEADPEIPSRVREEELAGLDISAITDTDKDITSEVDECPYAVDFASLTISGPNIGNTGAQTTVCGDTIQYYEFIINDLKAKIQGLEQKLEKQCYDVENLKDDDEKTNYFTGLAKYETLERLYTSVSPYLPTPKSEFVSKFHILLITLMKLRLDLPFKYLAYRFNLSTKTISKYFFDSVAVLSNKLKIVSYNFNVGTSDKDARWAYVDNVESGDIILPDRGYMSGRRDETFIAPLVRQKFVILNNLQCFTHEIYNGESVIDNVIKSCCALATLNPSSTF